MVVFVLHQFRKVLQKFLQFSLADDFQIVLNAGDDAELSVERFVWLDRLQQGDAYLVDHLAWFVRLGVDEGDRLVFDIDGLAVVDVLESLRIGAFGWDDVAISLRADCLHLDLHFLDVAMDSDLVEQAWKTSVLSGEVEGDHWLVVRVDWQTLGGVVWTKVGWGSFTLRQDVNTVVGQFGRVLHYVDAADVWFMMVLWILMIFWFIIIMRGFWLLTFQAWTHNLVKELSVVVMFLFWFQFSLDASVDLQLQAVWCVGLDWRQNRDVDLVSDNSGLGR